MSYVRNVNMFYNFIKITQIRICIFIKLKPKVYCFTKKKDVLDIPHLSYHFLKHIQFTKKKIQLQFFKHYLYWARQVCLQYKDKKMYLSTRRISPRYMQISGLTLSFSQTPTIDEANSPRPCDLYTILLFSVSMFCVRRETQSNCYWCGPIVAKRQHT